MSSQTVEWKKKSLGDLGKLHCGQSPKTADVNSEGIGTPYVTGPEQWNGNSVRQTKWTTTPKRLVPDGCIFITVKGAGVGKLFPGIACAIGRDVYAFEPYQSVDGKFVEHALRFTIGDIVRHARGDIPGLSKGQILEHDIGVPPLPEQRRIVARLEELFSHIDAGVAALHHAKAQLKRYRQSVLTAAVTGQLTQTWRNSQAALPAAWEHLAIGNIAQVQTGKTPKRSESEFWKDGTIPWLTSSATSSSFTHEARQFVTQAALDSGLKLFPPGTLLLAMYGEGKTRGQVTEITFQTTCNQACAAIIVDGSRAYRPYVRLRLQENYEQTRKAASGGNQPNLNLTKVREIGLPLPPLAEQHQIVAEVETRITVIDRLEAELKLQITRSNSLRQSILSSGFSGAL